MAQPSPNAFNTTSRFGVFQDLIVIFWDEKQNTEDEFWKFADSVNITKSRYYAYFDVATGRTITTLQIVDGINLAESVIKEWSNVPKRPVDSPDSLPNPICIYLGFQRDWWTRSDFYEILEWSEQLPKWVGFPVEVHWLPNDWFDSPGMAPVLTSGQDAIEWLEQQVQHYEPEVINYDYKGVHYEQPPF